MAERLENAKLRLECLRLVASRRYYTRDEDMCAAAERFYHYAMTGDSTAASLACFTESPEEPGQGESAMAQTSHDDLNLPIRNPPISGPGLDMLEGRKEKANRQDPLLTPHNSRKLT